MFNLHILSLASTVKGIGCYGGILSRGKEGRKKNFGDYGNYPMRAECSLHQSVSFSKGDNFFSPPLRMFYYFSLLKT